MGGSAVKISEVEMQAIREAAALSSRSISGQAEHWIRIGRAVERNPEFSYVRIEQALRGLLPITELSDAEHEDYLDRFSESMHEVTPEQKAFIADRKSKGLGVGLDEVGNVVYAKPQD